MDYVRPNVAIPAVSTLLPGTAAAHGGISAIGYKRKPASRLFISTSDLRRCRRTNIWLKPG